MLEKQDIKESVLVSPYRPMCWASEPTSTIHLKESPVEFSKLTSIPVQGLHTDEPERPE